MSYRSLVQSRWAWRVVSVAAVWAVAMALLPQPMSQARIGDGVHPIIVGGLKYTSNASCAGSGCHGEAEPKEHSGQWIGDENTIWAEHDPHAHGFLTLKDPASKAMADLLGIADAATSSRCLSCHAMDVPEPQRGELFAFEDAVGCESCHGPGEKYLNPHAEAGWTAAKRAQIGSEGLFKQFGLVDTSDLAARATTCVACHLQIDKDMIDAGHPPLEFELYAYNYYISKKGKEFAIHWNEPTGQLQDARLWATGQAAALAAADKMLADWKAKGWDATSAQSLRDLYAATAAVAKKHFGADTPVALSKAEFTPAKTAAAAADLAAIAPRATDAIQRRIVAFGVTALGAATFDGKGAEVPDAFWDAYATATTGEGGDAYLAAVKQLADLAQ
jgi:hypothetical protein